MKSEAEWIEYFEEAAFSAASPAGKYIAKKKAIRAIQADACRAMAELVNNRRLEGVAVLRSIVNEIEAEAAKLSDENH